MPTSLILLNAVTVAGGVQLPPAAVLTGIGFTCGAGTAEGTLSIATAADVDLASAVQVNPTVLAVHVYDSLVATSSLYDNLKIRLKDSQKLFCQGIGGLNSAFVLLKVQTPDS